MLTWTVTELEEGHPLDEILQLRIPTAPIGFVRKYCKKGGVTLEGTPLSADTRLRQGAHLCLKPSQRLDSLISESPLPPDSILFEDPQVLVVNKPANLATHRAEGHDDNLQAQVQAFIRLRGKRYRTAPAHRLDLGTSGPLLFGKGRQAISRLGQEFMANRISKHYLALVNGELPATGTLETPVPAHGKRKPACSHYRCLAQHNGLSLIELELVTGRLHQARRQLADAGWPIIGDERYGATDRLGLDRLFLHSHRLTFLSLIDKQPRQIDCPLPPPLQQLLTREGIIRPEPLDGD